MFFQLGKVLRIVVKQAQDRAYLHRAANDNSAWPYDVAGDAAEVDVDLFGVQTPACNPPHRPTEQRPEWNK